MVGDVATEEAARQAVSVALKEFGRLDFAVNNAGVSPWRKHRGVHARDVATAD